MNDKTHSKQKMLIGGGIILLGIGKSIWRSTLSVLYLIVYSYLLFALINYYGLSELTIDNFLGVLTILVGNWGLFWIIFFISNLYDELRDGENVN